ncbi:hypothetical protein EUGRSUZ_L00425, partial [Eucalyptus grandis]
KLALLAFKVGITRDPFGVLNSWNNSIGFCQWHGITCGQRHRRVTVLNLSSQELSGLISPHIGNFSFLREMRLQNNSLDHEIPPQVGQLRHLHVLLLDNNSLVGKIPKNISGCLDLFALSISYNELTGKIPRELGSLPKLQKVNLNFNNLSGSIPFSIGNLSSLAQLSLAWNNLGGSIPQVLGHRTNLQVISLTKNRFSGKIPSSLFNLSLLISFEVSLNQIQGTLPASMGLKLPNLEKFSVDGKQLEGLIPPSISNCTKLGWLQFQRIDFLGNTKLHAVDIGLNKFGGVLPKCLGNLSTTLNFFYAFRSKIYGEIPEEIGNLVNLELLVLGFNQFSGVIPSNLGNLQNLVILQLSHSNLRGTIPSSLGNLTKLIQVHLQGNNFHGQIPSHLSNCRSLILLYLSYNNLSGAIPPQLFSLSSLAISLSLFDNHLTGALPIEVGNLRALTMLDISNNLLVGEIPSSLGDCSSLAILGMQGNFFHKSIPQSIRSLKGIEELDLSHNNLSGQIPEFLAVFRFLKRLNLSYNKFEGMLPCEGVFKNATSTSIVGNNDLCGGLPEFHLPNCLSKSHKSRKINIVIVVASVISGVVGMAFIAAFIYLCWVKKKVNEPVSSSMDDSRMNVSYGTILKATEGFSSANLIGVGSFGSVYKGILEDNGTIVAVKVLHLVRHGALKSFIVECEAFKNVKHRNLLKLLTICSGSDYQGIDFKALVYEFMDNGSLEQWLHSYTTSSHDNMLPKKLNFIWRINIAIDVASALDYLHHQCHIPIVHCDLKPSNILLDAEKVAHLGDFGLAKFLLESSFETVDNHMSSMSLRGTMDYAPPEYAMGCKVSREGDVYSYGILLLEIFTGLRPTDDKFRDHLTIHSFVAEALPERVLEITDIFLLQERESHLGPYSCRHWSSERDNIFQECLVMMYNIGVACSYQIPGRRMSINEAANQLHRIRKKLFAW